MPAPVAYTNPDEAAAGLTAAFGPTTDAQKAAIAQAASLVPTKSVVPGEPAVISSRSGAQAFQTTVQPKIDTANATVDAATAARVATAKAAAEKAVSTGDPIPQDVLDEINASTTPEDQVYATQLAAWDKQEQAAKDSYANLTLASNASANAQISTLTGQWVARKQLLEQSNNADVANWNQQFIRSGQAEYSPGMTGTFITGKEQEGMAKVKALDDDYNAQIAQVNAALQQNDYELAAKLTSDLSDIQDKALAQMSENAKEAAAVNQKISDANTQATLEMTISNAVKQGITDPTEIQSYLDETGAGQQIGNVSLDDIAGVLKIVNPAPDLSGLSADYKTYKYLQDNNDPAVQGLDYYGYLKAVHIASTNPPAADGVFKFSQTQQSQLLSGGFSLPDITNLQADVAASGLDAVLANPSLTETQKTVLRRTLAGSDSVSGLSDPGQQFITTDYLEGLFSDDALKKAAAADGYRHLLTSWSTEKATYLAHLMDTVKQYRIAGYNDQDILKMMQ